MIVGLALVAATRRASLQRSFDLVAMWALHARHHHATCGAGRGHRYRTTEPGSS